MRFSLASVLLCVVGACGDSGTHKLADAPSGTDGPGGSDARGIDAATQPVTVIVTLLSAPAPGVKVYFLNADGSVVANAQTGSDGTASAVMAAGGSVTAIEPLVPQARFQSPTQRDTLDTWLGVRPGDQLHLDVASAAAASTTFALNVVVPGNAAATTFQLDTSCGASFDITPITTGSGGALRGPHAVPVVPPNASVPISLSCPAGTTDADLLVRALDQTGTLVGSIYAPATPLADGATITITDAYADPESDVFAFTGMGSAETGVSIAKAFAGPRGIVFQTGTTVNFTAGAGSTTLVYPFTAGAAEQLVATDFSNDGSVFETQSGFDWAPATQNVAYTGAQLLPHFTSMPAFDSATRATSWTQDTATRVVDAAETSVVIHRTSTLPDSSIIQNTWAWNVVAPGTDAGNVVLPTVPTDVFDYNPAAPDSVQVTSASTLSVSGGYDFLRPLAFARFDPTSAATPGSTGSIWVTNGQVTGTLRAAPRGPRSLFGRQ